MRLSRRAEVTPATITKVVLPVIYVGALFRLLARRHSDDPAVRDMAVALATVAVAVSTLPPKSLNLAADVLGDANYARVVSQLGTVVAAGYGSNVLLRSAHEDTQASRRVRRRRARMVATLGVVGSIFVRDRSTASELQSPTLRIYQPQQVVYWTTFSAFMVDAASETARLSLTASRVTDDEALRRGLRYCSVGTGVLAGFYGHLAIGVTAKALFPRLPGPLRGIPAQAVIGACAALVAYGSSLPGAAWRARRLSQAFDDARMAAQLKYLWRPFQRRNPGLSVHVSPFAPGVQLHRRVIEILDGLDALGHKHDPHGDCYRQAAAVGAQNEFDGDDVTALYRAAMMRLTQGSSPLTKPELIHAQTTPPLTGGKVDRDWREEGRRLLRTVHMLRSSPLPDLVARQIASKAV